MQAELDANNDPASVRVVVTVIDGNDADLKIYLHRPGEDRFTEFDVPWLTPSPTRNR